MNLNKLLMILFTTMNAYVGYETFHAIITHPFGFLTIVFSIILTYIVVLVAKGIKLTFSI